MATLPKQNPYQCGRCGTRDITAAPVLFQQGTRTYSGMFRWGTSQTQSAQLAAPPRRKSNAGPLLRWAFPLCFCFFWGISVLSTILQHQTTAKTEIADVLLLLLGAVFLGGLMRSLRQITRYNREVFPQLLRDWENTYICQKCGNSTLISE